MNKLRVLTDKALLLSLKKLVHTERKTNAAIILHLSEVYARRLFSELKYPSLFSYCVEELKYSEDQAWRRISAMRLCERNKVAKAKINAGELSLTNACMLNGFFGKNANLKQKEKDAAVEAAAGKSKRACEKLLEGLRPEEKSNDTKQQKSVKISSATYEKLLKLANLRAHEKLSVDQLLAEALEDALLKKRKKMGLVAPAKKERRPPTAPARLKLLKAKKTISVHTKRDVWKRAQGKCEKCGGKRALQWDHRTPRSLGGANAPSNIRLLCRHCNFRAGVNAFGGEKMNVYRE